MLNLNVRKTGNGGKPKANSLRPYVDVDGNRVVGFFNVLADNLSEADKVKLDSGYYSWETIPEGKAALKPLPRKKDGKSFAGSKVLQDRLERFGFIEASEISEEEQEEHDARIAAEEAAKKA